MLLCISPFFNIKITIKAKDFLYHFFCYLLSKEGTQSNVNYIVDNSPFALPSRKRNVDPGNK